MSAEKERDEAKEEERHARLAIVTVGDAKVLAEDKLARVQDALVVAKEAKCKVEAKATCIEVERTSLLLEIRTSKDEVSFLHSQTGKDKEAMEKDYHKDLKTS